MNHRGLLVPIDDLALNEVLVYKVPTTNNFVLQLLTASIAFDSFLPISRSLLLMFRLLELILLFPIGNCPCFPALNRLYNSCISKVNAIDQVIFLSLADFVNLEVVLDFIRAHIGFITSFSRYSIAWLDHVLSDTTDVLITLNIITLR